MSHLRPLAVLLSAVVVACAGTKGPRAGAEPKPADAAPVDPIRASQEAARQAAIDDLYERWRYDYTMFQKAITDLQAQRAAQPEPAANEPVRSLEELLRDTAPEEHDPETKRLFDLWRQKSNEYDTRLRQLSSDPQQDPRSPLLPEVRESLVPASPPR